MGLLTLTRDDPGRLIVQVPQELQDPKADDEPHGQADQKPHHGLAHKRPHDVVARPRGVDDRPFARQAIEHLERQRPGEDHLHDVQGRRLPLRHLQLVQDV